MQVIKEKDEFICVYNLAVCNPDIIIKLFDEINGDYERAEVTIEDSILVVRVAAPIKNNK